MDFTPGFTITSGSGTSTITVSINTGAAVGNGQNVTVQAHPCGNNNSKTDKINVGGFNGVTASPSSASVCSDGSISVVGTLTEMPHLNLVCLKWRFFKYCYSEQIQF
jgi:hypothetical protein